MSENSKIATALAKAQSEMGSALKQSANPAFRSKYADLGNVMDACLPALNANGIAVIQPAGADEDGRYVETILLHASGERLSCRVPLIVAKNDMQGYGSAVTYARRYGIMCMAGIAPEDDDGNAAAKAPPRAEDKLAPVDVEAERAWFTQHLPGMKTVEEINAVLGRSKKAGRDIQKLVVARANAMGLHYDESVREYVYLEATQHDPQANT